MGNLRSVEKAFEHLGAPCRIQTHLDGIDRLVIPGVGAFGAAVSRLSPLFDDIRSAAGNGLPILGICLGMQLLLETSEEMGEHRGLGLIGGRVRYLPRDRGLKVPHIGWTRVLPVGHCSILESFAPDTQQYFVHSLYADCSDQADVSATAEYGIEFAAAVCRGNVRGVQFHPEKSGEVGLEILGRFSEC
jgi:glutamine amidotransferase